MSPSRYVPPAQTTAFHRAICERLGIDPALVSESDFHVEMMGGEELSPVTLTAFVPTEDLIAMFNAAGGNG